MKYFTHGISLLLLGIIILSINYAYNSQEMFQTDQQTVEGVQEFCQPDDEKYESCLEITYFDINNVKQNGKVLLLPGYFVNAENMVEKIQTLNDLSTPTPQPSLPPPEFLSDNIDATFHGDFDKPEHRTKNSIWHRNYQGKLEKVYYADISNTTLYYDPSEYPYGPSSYVPDYEESTKLSYYSHSQEPEKDSAPIDVSPATSNPLFIQSKHKKLTENPAYVSSLRDLDDVNQQSEEKMKSYTIFP